MIDLSYTGGDLNIGKKAVAGIVIVGATACMTIAVTVYSKISAR